MVMGPPRKGLKVTYCTDSRPADVIGKYAAEADLFICEGMYGEPDKLSKAKEYKHMTMYEAATIASKAAVNQLWLTHYSPSMAHPEEFLDKVKEIFPATIAARDGKNVTLKFEDA